MLKMKTSPIIWLGKHPNFGQNKQHLAKQMMRLERKYNEKPIFHNSCFLLSLYNLNQFL